jgi:hypothetical protein
MNRMKRAIELLTLLCLFPLTALAAESGFHLVEISHVDDVGSGITTTGPVKIEMREVITEMPAAKGTTRTLGVVVLYEPSSGALLWRIWNADRRYPSLGLSHFKESQTLYLFFDTLIDFAALPDPNMLFICEHRGHASSIDQATAEALDAASASNDPLGDLERGLAMHKISLRDLGPEFTNPPMNVAPTPISLYPKVIDVRRDADHWIVTLQSRWKEAITLDSKYNLVSMKKLE